MSVFSASVEGGEIIATLGLRVVARVDRGVERDVIWETVADGVLEYGGTERDATEVASAAVELRSGT